MTPSSVLRKSDFRNVTTSPGPGNRMKSLYPAHAVWKGATRPLPVAHMPSEPAPLDRTVIATCPVCGGARGADSALCETCTLRGLTRVPGAGPCAGRQIGSYVLAEPLGEGGMGLVWLATHVREERIRAAVKFIRHEANPDRFLAERRYLASLAHPNIARIYDVGQTDDGALYLTMEFVEGGAPLTKWCDGQKLPIPARLRLFQEVCHAVQHIHLKGLIHRDLKPANILVAPVDGQPVPRVIDFGIAKPIADAGAAEFADPAPRGPARLDEEGALLTRAGRFVGTLEYSSPEQLRGEKVDPRSDVYALGLILYELLTGLRPHSKEEMNLLRERAGITRKSASSLSDEDVSRLAGVLAAERPTAPSERLRRATTTTAAGTLQEIAARRGLTANSLPRVLSRDLEAIIMRALAAAPDDRYASPDALAADIENHLQRRPVTAIPPTLPYLTRKFLHRYPWQAAAAAALLLSLAGGIVASSAFARSESKAKSAAVSARRAAETARNTAEDGYYAADIQGVVHDAAQNRVAAVRERLRRHRTEESGRDLRHWEYYYLRSRLDQSALAVAAHPGGVNAVTVSPDMRSLATAGEDGTVALWETASLLEVRRLTGHRHAVLCAAWAPDPRYLATGDAGGSVIVWELESGRPFATLQLPADLGRGPEESTAVRSVAWLPQDSGRALRLAVGGEVFAPLVAEVPPDGGDLTSVPLARSQPFITGLSWAPDGSRLAASHLISNDPRARQGRTGVVIFDAAGGDILNSFKPPSGSDSYCVAWHPSMPALLAAGDKHATVRIIDLDPEEDGRSPPAVTSLSGHREYVSALAWHPRGAALLSAGGDSTLRWHRQDGEGDWQTTALTGHAGPVKAAAIALLPGKGSAAEGAGSNERAAFYSGGADGTLRAWWPGGTTGNGSTGLLKSWVSSVKFRPGTPIVAAGRFMGAVWLIDTRIWQYVQISPAGRNASVFDVDWSPDGRRLALACMQADCIEIHTPYDSAGPRQSFPLSYPRHVAWSRSGRYLAAAGRTACVVWDPAAEQLLCEINSGAGSLVWGAEDDQLFLGGRDGHIALWNPLTKTLTRTLRAAPPVIAELVPNENEPPRQVHDLRWHAQRGHLLYGTQDSTAGILDPADGREWVRLATGHISGIWRVAWSPDGHRAATAGQDGTLRICDASSGREIVRMDHGEGTKEVRGLDWSADGETIITAGFDQKVQTWDAARGRRLEQADALTPEACAALDHSAALSLSRELTLLGRPSLALAAAARAAAHLPGPVAAAEDQALRTRLRQAMIAPEALLEIPDTDLPHRQLQPEDSTRQATKEQYATAAMQELEREDTAAALDLLNEGLELYPSSTTLLNHRGVLLWTSQGRLDEARADFAKAETLLGDRTEYARQLTASLAASCAWAAGEKETATRHITPTLARWPDLQLPPPAHGAWPAAVITAFSDLKAATAASPAPEIPDPPPIPPTPPSPRGSATRHKEVDAR